MPRTNWSSIASQPIISIDWGASASATTSSNHITLSTVALNDLWPTVPPGGQTESETKLKTVVLSVGEDTTYQIGVTLNEPALIRAILAANPPVSMVPLVEGRDEVTVRRFTLDGKDCSLAAMVATASILTGRNILNDGVIPFGSTNSSGMPLTNTNPNDRGYGVPITDRPDLLSFLEPTEFDPSFIRDEHPPTPPQRRRWWVLYGLDACSWWNEDYDDWTEDEDEATRYTFNDVNDMADWEALHNLGRSAWQAAR